MAAHVDSFVAEHRNEESWNMEQVHLVTSPQGTKESGARNRDKHIRSVCTREQTSLTTKRRSPRNSRHEQPKKAHEAAVRATLLAS